MIALAATTPSWVKKGCCVHCAALSLLSGSTTKSLETRSFASGEKPSSIGLYAPARTLYSPAMECSKGMDPLTRRYISTPTAHMSDCCPYAARSSTSGAWKSEVPIGCSFSSRAARSKCVALPKSMSTSCLGFVSLTIKFAGFRSRYTMSRECT